MSDDQLELGVPSLREMRPSTPSRSRLLWRGITGACGVCGRRRGLVTRRLGLVETCPRCGFRFERQPGHFVGAVGMNTVVTFALLAIVLVGTMALTAPDIPVVPLFVAGGLIAVVFPLAFHPVARTLWIAVDLAMHPLEPGEAARWTEEASPRQR